MAITSAGTRKGENMKTIKLFILFGIISIVLLSCDNPVSLGARLDLDGPTVEFTSPTPRKAVGSDFVVEGTAKDNSGVSVLLLRAEIGTQEGTIPYGKQWRYDRGIWGVSEDFGVTWVSLSGTAWIGSVTDAIWRIPVDMKINGKEPDDGEYTFVLQAWDVAGNTDENSFKTRVFIIDTDPPKVDVSNPFLYNWYKNQWNDRTDELNALHIIPDNGSEKTNPAMIGKFITQSFLMQWQIDDNHDVWSIDLRLYKHDGRY